MTHICSCAKCQDIQPWTERFAQCIQTGWIIASDAVAAGIASPVPHDD